MGKAVFGRFALRDLALLAVTVLAWALFARFSLVTFTAGGYCDGCLGGVFISHVKA